jgi:hypothetical protein
LKPKTELWIFFVLDQTRIGGTDYILVTEEEEGDSDALILKDTSKDGDEEALYEIVEDERELSAVAEVFAKMDDDIAFE